MAQDHARPVRLGSGSPEGELPAGPILPSARRHGPKQAICAVAASILTSAYHMLKDGSLYQDLGADHFDRRAKDVHIRHLVARLQALGCTVEIKPTTVGTELDSC